MDRDKIKIIRGIACFSKLTVKQCESLAGLLHEISFAPFQNIVTENELIDSIYFIVSGEAEVCHEITTGKRKRRVPLAILHPGESIGLNDMGFYSNTEKRTATVTALKEMLLLRLDIKDLNRFLREHDLESTMYAASEQMLRIHLIKQSLPFAKLSHERLSLLASHVQIVTVSAGNIIFNQGEKGDKCYLIRSGELEILSTNDRGVTRRIALLKPPALFGEATLLSRSVRNATAYAITDCELLALEYDFLAELIESEENVASMLMTLMVHRSMPIQNPNISVHHRMTADGQKVTILKNQSNGKYFKLSEEGAFIWEQLNGYHTLQDITLDLAETKNVFAPDMVAALVSKLLQADFIQKLAFQIDTSKPHRFWMKAFLKLRGLLVIRKAFGDADQWITRIYEKYIRYLFTVPAQIILLTIIMTGLVVFWLKMSVILHFFAHKHISLLLLLGLIPLGLIAVFLHELGHAFAVKAFGHEVHYIGIGWNWIAPLAFTDTSDMWLATRKPRMLVNLAGIYVDLVVAGISSLLILVMANPYLQGMLWLFALTTYIGALRMLSPLQEMDGYYVLMDWLEKNKLRQSSVLWLVKKFPKWIRKPSESSGNRAEKFYWLACLIYLLIITLLTFLVQKFVIKVLGFTSPNVYLMLILPFLVMIVSSLTVIAEIKNQSEDESL